MSVIEIILVAAGLSADAFAASVSDGMVMRRKRRAVFTAALFGIFQAVMPLLGYLLGSGFAGLIAAYDHFIALAVLGFIGGKAVIEGISELRSGCECLPDSEPSLGILFAQGAATSIDAFVVGVSFAAVGAEPFGASAIIGAVTFAICLVGTLAGRKFGELLGTKAEIAGGIVLIAIGVKTFLEHTVFA
ncbi:MAG: manganese efflux pump MntP family protein [Oscillospiraceae bacterium]